MWKKILALFQSGKICTIISQVESGLASTLVVLKYVKDELAKTEAGKKLIPYVDKVVNALVAFKTGLDKIAAVFCGEVVAQAKGRTLEESLADLDKITKDLTKVN